MNKAQAPYFDDTRDDSNYKQVLFAAGRPVQARELNSIQSTFTNQTEKFAGHIFKNGSRVSNGAVSVVKYEWVRLAAQTPANTDVNVVNISPDHTLVGDSSGVEARLVHAVNAINDDPATLYVVYTKTGIDAAQVRFVPGETIKVNDEHGNTVYEVVVKCPSCPGALDPQDTIEPCAMGGLFLNVADGVFYYNGFFVSVKQTMVLFSKYGEAVTCKIGFDVSERVVTAEEDPTLYDNALGYPNETAPGADRLAVEFTLVKRDNVIADGSKFVELASVENGYVQTLKSDYQYAAIMDTMAKRTFEESGNYTVQAWKPRYIENKKQTADDPRGFILTGDEDKVTAVLTPGVGYVRGYRVETASDTVVHTDKARSTNKVNNGTVYFEEGSYVDLVPDTTLSVWPNNPQASGAVTLEEIQLYDGDPVAHAPSGQVVGGIRVADAVYIGDNQSGAPIYRYKVIDYRVNAGAVVKCVSHETNRFLAVPHGQFAIQNTSKRDMFFEVPKTNVKSLRDSDNDTRGSMTILMRKKLTATLDAGGKYTFTVSNAAFDSNINNTIIIVGSAGDYVYVKPDSNNCKPNGTSMELDIPAHPGKTVTVIHSVTSIDVIEKTKQSQTHIVTGKTRVDTNNFANAVPLGRADVYQIEYVRAYSHLTPATYEDVTDKFVLDNGVRPYAYEESSIKMKEGEGISMAFDTIDIKVRFFAHSDPNGAGYFTIDSYRTVIGDVDSGITYANLPVFYKTDGSSVTADQIIDFRVVHMGNNAGSVPATKSTAIFDMEYYVGRRDLLAVDSESRFFHIKGVPSDNPKAPTNVSEYIMPLYEVYIPPYTYAASDIKIKLIENKRYTMRDIGRLEKRIDNLEYYTTLTMLESQAAAANVKDANGLDRYKNGFVVDDFSKYGTGDTASNEFRALIDRERGELRPLVHIDNRDAKHNATASSGFVVKNGVAMFDYDSVVADEQPFASRALSINPYLVFRKAGNLSLTPNVDSWADTDRQPDMNVEIDTGVDAFRQLANRTNSIVTAFNDHVFANATIQTGTVAGALGTLERQSASVVSSTSSTRRTAAATTTTTTTTTTRTNVDTRTESVASVESRTNTYTFDRVTDVRIVPYMRATDIEFTASGLAPNTRFYVFFDDQDVTALTTQQGSTNKISTALAAGMLLSDEKGVLSGSIAIPEGRFFTGTRDVRITNDPQNTKNENNETSYAQAQFFAGGISQAKQNVNLNVVTPVYSERDVVSTRTSTNTTTSRTTQTWQIPQPTFTRTGRNDGGRGGDRDPVAQSFKLEYDCFVSKLSLWFENIEKGQELWFEIRTMDNGYPTETVLGRAVRKSDSLQGSLDASVETVIEFPTPVRVQANVEYCFVVGGDSPSTRIWIAKLGEPCVNVPGKICDTQVTLGSSFRSQNASTWNAEQYEDVMYRLHICKFKSQQGTIAFDVSGGIQHVALADAPFEGERNTNMVRVHCKHPHGLVEGDKVTLNLYPNEQYSVSLTNGHLCVGHELQIDNGAGSAVVTRVEYTNATICVVTLGNLQGNITPSSTFIASPFLKRPSGKDVMLAHYDAEVEDFDIRQAAGQFTSTNTATELNGFPVAKLNKTLQVKRVDDSVTFILEMDELAAHTGRFGPRGATAMVNIKADMLNFAGAYIAHDATEQWTITATAHGEDGSEFETHNYRTLEPMSMTPGADRYLPQPIKIASLVNEQEHLAGKPSLAVVGKFASESELLSPTLNIGTFSATFINNDVGVIDPAVMNASPNGSNRFVPETHSAQGSERYKYVTKSINLQNPAADLRIWFDMFKPKTADFDIYVKLQTGSVENIDNTPWVKLENIDKQPVSSSINDFIEYDMMLSDLMPALGGLGNLFGSFKVKIVANSRNSAEPPVFRNLRLIAHT